MKKTTGFSRMLSLLLALVMVLGMVPAAAPAAQAAGSEPGPGIYDVPILNLESKAPIQSVKEQFKTGFGTSMQVVIDENGRFATLTPRHMTINYLGKNHGANITHVNGATPSAATHEEIYHAKRKYQFGDLGPVYVEKTSVIYDYWTLKLPPLGSDGRYPMQVKVDWMSVNQNKGFMDVWLTPDWNHAVRNTAAEAAPVIEQIEAIGKVTLESETAILAARAAYDKLVPESRKKVTNYAALEAAEAKLQKLKDEAAQAELDKAAAAAVDKQIAAIGKVTLESETAIQEARKAYTDLNDQARTYVKNLATLEAAEAELKKLKDAAAQAELDKVAAAAVDQKIAAIGKVTLESEPAILDARKAYTDLNAQARTYVQNLATLEKAEAALAELKKPVAPVLKEGSYMVPIVSLTSGAPIQAVAQEFAKSFGTEVRLNVAADGTMTAVIMPQHMVVNFNGIYHCNIMKIKSAAGEATYDSMKTELVTPTFGQPEVTQDILCPSKAQVILPQPNEKGGYPLTVTADFMNGMNGGIEKDHWMDVVLNLDLAQAKPAGPSYEYGSQKTVIKPGCYSIPAALMHADHHQEPSMAAAAVKAGFLEIMENGDAYITVNLGPVNAFGITGWSRNWKIYPTYEYGDTLAPNDPIVAKAVPAEVLSTTVVNTPAPDGSSASDIEYPTAIRFKLPYSEKDGTYVTMNVPVMDAYPNAFLSLDFANVKPAYVFGTKKTPVAPGEYYIPTALMHAAHHEKPSMAAAAILGGKLTVEADGTAYVNVKLGPVDAYGMHGWSTNWKVYDVFQCESQLPDDPKTLPLKEAEVVATAVENGETYPSEIRFKLPFTDQDGVYVTMFVPIMGAYPNGLLSLDYTKLENYDQHCADQVVAMIMANLTDDQGQMDRVVTLDEEPAIIATRKAYEALTENQKALVGENAYGIDMAEGLLVQAKIADIGQVTLESEQKILAARKGYDALTAAGRENVNNLPVLEEAEKQLAALKGKPSFFGSTMTAGNSLKMNFYIVTADLKGQTQVRAVITKQNADGTESSREIPFEQWRTKGKYSVVDFDGLTAKEMMDPITLKVVDAQGQELTEVYRDSIHDYAIRTLEDPQIKPALRTLMVDMLNYGAACQTHFGYNAGKLANGDIGQYQQYATKTATCTDSRTRSGLYYGTSLSAKSNILMSFYFRDVTDSMHAVVRYTNHHGEQVELTVPAGEMTAKGTLRYVRLEKLVVADVFQKVTCTLYDGETEVGAVTDSMESYVARSTEADGPVPAEIMKFGAAAHSYFHGAAAAK